MNTSNRINRLDKTIVIATRYHIADLAREMENDGLFAFSLPSLKKEQPVPNHSTFLTLTLIYG
jgi:hypothetical protein